MAFPSAADFQFTDFTDFPGEEWVKSGEEWRRVVRHSSPLATPVFIGVSADLVKSEE